MGPGFLSGSPAECGAFRQRESYQRVHLYRRQKMGCGWMKKSHSLCFVFLFLIALSGLATGQDGVSLNILDIRSNPGGNVEMVVSVVEENGISVKGLNKASFRLILEGKEVKEFSLEPYSSTKSPLSVILGIDVSGSMEGAAIKEAKKGASIFLDQLDKEDFSTLMSFGSSVRFLTDFTGKKHEIREKIESLTANEMSTLLYQATLEGLEKSSKAPTSRAALVLLTDGKDEGSPAREEDVVARIKKTPIPIYTIGFGPEAQVEYLKKVALMSGGYFLSTPKAEELSSVYSLVVDQLKNQYLLQFNYPKPTGEYACILTLKHQGKEVNARRAFLHVTTESAPGWRGGWKSQLVWGIVVLALIMGGLAIVYQLGLFRRPKPEPVEEAGTKEEPDIRLMIRKKFYPICLPSGLLKPTATVVLPASSKGEVGFEIDIQQPLPLDFAMIDKKNRIEYDEVIITRYDEDRERLHSEEKIYLFFSDRSVTRPSDERGGHARVFMDRRTGTYQIEDLGSTSGTLVNGKGLKKGGPLALVNGDSIMVGRVTLKYYDRRPLLETHF